MDEQGSAGPGQQLSWLLDDLGKRVEHFQQAVILSRDGLAVAASQNLSREDAEHLSALAAGVQSLARGAGEHFGVGEVRQTIIELERAFLFVTAAGHGSCLAVLCSSSADAGPHGLRDGHAGEARRASPGGAPEVPGRSDPGGVSAACPAATGGWTGTLARSSALTR